MLDGAYHASSAATVAKEGGLVLTVLSCPLTNGFGAEPRTEVVVPEAM